MTRSHLSKNGRFAICESSDRSIKATNFLEGRFIDSAFFFMLMSSVEEGAFKKKRFTLRSGLVSFWIFINNLPNLFRAFFRGNIDRAFAEKIMLAVTAVNECRYCQRAHTKQAVEAGVSKTAIKQILQNDIENAVNSDELPALQFAQQYAEANQNPDPAARSQLEKAYSPEIASDIVAYVRSIYFSNLAGNTIDYCLFRLQSRLPPK